MKSEEAFYVTVVVDHSEAGWAYKVLFDDLDNCACGRFHERLELVRQALRDCPSYELKDRSAYETPEAEWLLLTMERAGLITHGVYISSFGITEKGARFLAALEDPTIWRELTEAELGYCGCGDCPGDAL